MIFFFICLNFYLIFKLILHCQVRRGCYTFISSPMSSYLTSSPCLLSPTYIPYAIVTTMLFPHFMLCVFIQVNPKETFFFTICAPRKLIFLKAHYKGRFFFLPDSGPCVPMSEFLSVMCLQVSFGHKCSLPWLYLAVK